MGRGPILTLGSASRGGRGKSGEKTAVAERGPLGVGSPRVICCSLRFSASLFLFLCFRLSSCFSVTGSLFLCLSVSPFFCFFLLLFLCSLCVSVCHHVSLFLFVTLFLCLFLYFSFSVLLYSSVPLFLSI